MMGISKDTTFMEDIKNHEKYSFLFKPNIVYNDSLNNAIILYNHVKCIPTVTPNTEELIIDFISSMSADDILSQYISMEIE